MLTLRSQAQRPHRKDCLVAALVDREWRVRKHDFPADRLVFVLSQVHAHSLTGAVTAIWARCTPSGLNVFELRRLATMSIPRTILVMSKNPSYNRKLGLIAHQRNSNAQLFQFEEAAHHHSAEEPGESQTQFRIKWYHHVSEGRKNKSRS